MAKPARSFFKLSTSPAWLPDWRETPARPLKIVMVFDDSHPCFAMDFEDEEETNTVTLKTEEE